MRASREEPSRAQIGSVSRRSSPTTWLFRSWPLLAFGAGKPSRFGALMSISARGCCMSAVSVSVLAASSSPRRQSPQRAFATCQYRRSLSRSCAKPFVFSCQTVCSCPSRRKPSRISGAMQGGHRRAVQAARPAAYLRHKACSGRGQYPCFTIRHRPRKLSAHHADIYPYRRFCGQIRAFPCL